MHECCIREMLRAGFQGQCPICQDDPDLAVLRLRCRLFAGETRTITGSMHCELEAAVEQRPTPRRSSAPEKDRGTMASAVSWLEDSDDASDDENVGVRSAKRQRPQSSLHSCGMLDRPRRVVEAFDSFAITAVKYTGVSQDRSCSSKPGFRPRKHPADMGFEEHRRLLLRSAQVCKAHLADTSFPIEIGSIDKVKFGSLGLRNGKATCEVLCNRMSLLGNPFHMKKNEALRHAVCDAFGEYLNTVMQAKPRELLNLGPLLSLAARIAPKYGLSPGVHFSQDWCRDFGSREPAELRSTFVALGSLVRARAARGETVRLLCHCAPRRCHCEDIAAALEFQEYHQDVDISSSRSEYSTNKCEDFADGQKRRKRTLCRYSSPPSRSEARLKVEY